MVTFYEVASTSYVKENKFLSPTIAFICVSIMQMNSPVGGAWHVWDANELMGGAWFKKNDGFENIKTRDSQVKYFSQWRKYIKQIIRIS